MKFKTVAASFAQRRTRMLCKGLVRRGVFFIVNTFVKSDGCDEIPLEER